MPFLHGLPFHCPPLINLNMASSECQVSVGILAQYPQPPPPKLPTTVPPNLTIVSFRGHLTDKNRCCFRGKERKCFFSPGSTTFSTNVILSFTFTAPTGSLVIPFVLTLWMEKLSHTLGLQVLIRQLEHRALFLFFGLELYLISINKILRRIWLFYFKQISS